MSKKILIRIQSPEHGTKRIEIKSSESTAGFLNKIQELFGLGDIGWRVYKSRDKTDPVRNSRAKTIDSCKIKHGEMLYLYPDPGQTLTDGNGDDRSSDMSVDDSKPSSASNSDSAKRVSVMVVEDDIDQHLWKLDGRIPRQRNDQLCRHGPKGKCFHCVPLEPYDETYLRSCNPPIKFLSFHSYLRKLRGGVDKGKFVILENISCRIKPGCTEHPPWPGGICTKCQPNAVTLNRQKYRHVDNIMFENPSIAERFLNFWRSTANQRLGILYGRCEAHKDVPLGIKATVSAIYEPPQISTNNKIELLPDENEGLVNEVSAKLGISPVGWIFTDLLAEDLRTGTVKHFRGNIDSHFLSAEECIMAATFQNKYPNPCKLSPDGHFGSKFVTVVVTGDNTNQIHFDAYQVSNQCMALVNDDCLVPTKDAPELGFVKESSNEQYVPDVFFMEKDEYGNQVTQLARPLPVEYLLVDLPVGFPMEPQSTFQICKNGKSFPAENRSDLGETQDINALIKHMENFPPDQFLEAISDFHLLLFLAKSDMLSIRHKMDVLLEAVKNKDHQKAEEFKRTEEWATVEEIIAAHGPSPPVSRQASYVGPGASPLPPIASSGSMWTCSHCTYINQPDKSACDMCSLPK